jgi:hypothetical protein
MKLIIKDIDLEQSEKTLREFYNSNTHFNQEVFNKESIIKNLLNEAAKYKKLANLNNEYIHTILLNQDNEYEFDISEHAYKTFTKDELITFANMILEFAEKT